MFPINYFLAAAKVIGAGESVSVYLLLTLLMKAFFAATLADVHTHVLLTAREDLEKERQANESRRAFLQYLFHEVRTPLNSLTMGIELLKAKDLLVAEDQELLDMMTGASDGMAEKIEEGKMELTFAPFSISGSITKVFTAMSAAAAAKNVKMEEHIAADVPPLLVGDVYRVEHVIVNLLSNAVKFSPVGGVIRLNVTSSLTKKRSSVSSPSTRIKVSISDAGPGLSEEDQSKLFGGFFHVRPEHIQQGNGSGLGLALCKQIVNLHGGTIGVVSEEGQGSTFYFSIPFCMPIEESQDDIVLELPRISPPPLSLLETTLRSSSYAQESAVQEFFPRMLVVDGESDER